MRVPRSFSSMPSSALRNLPEAAGCVGASSRAAVRICWVRRARSSLTCWRSLTILSISCGGRVVRRLAGGASGILLSHQVAHVIGLLLLLGRQLIGGLGHRVEAAGGVLLLHAAKQVGGFAQAVGGAAGIGRAGILRGGAPHVVVGLAQAVERLLGRLLAAVGGLFGGLLADCPPDWPTALAAR